MKKLTTILFLIFSIFFFSHLNVNANNDAVYSWAKQVGGSGVDSGNSIIIDSNNNFYVVGYFNGTVDFDPGDGTSNLISAGGNDAFILKLDSSGNFVWVKQMGSTGADSVKYITLDSSNNIYTIGHFNGTVDFDPGDGTSNLISAGGNDIFILKLDSSGNFVWVKQIGSTGADSGNSIKIDSLNNIYTTGRFQNTVDFDPGDGTSNLISAGSDDIFILKLDSLGNFVWVKQMGSTGGEAGVSVTIDSLDNIYTTGYFNGTVDLDPGVGISNFISNGGYDAFILKLDSSGNFIWNKQIGGTDNEWILSMVTDSENNLYSTGVFANTVDFDSGVGVSNLTALGAAGNGDIFILKLDSSGNFVWVKQTGGILANDSGNSITIDSSKNVYTTGVFQDVSDFDPGTGVSNLTAIGSSQDIFISKLSFVANLPTITTDPASSLTRTTATLNGAITNTGGENNTTRGFNYGLDTNYGSTTTESGSFSEESYTADISSLICNTTYHYRSYSSNTAGTGYGDDQTFITDNCPSVVSGTSPEIINTFKLEQQKLSTSNIQTITTIVDQPSPLSIFRTLKYKMTGEDVKALQIYLNTHNYPVSQTGIGSLNHESTYFGLKTKQAVMKFQKANNLKADGIVGVKTRELLK